MQGVEGLALPVIRGLEVIFGSFEGAVNMHQDLCVCVLQVREVRAALPVVCGTTTTVQVGISGWASALAMAHRRALSHSFVPCPG